MGACCHALCQPWRQNSCGEERCCWGQGIEGREGEGFFQAHVNASFYTSSFVSTMGFLRVSVVCYGTRSKNI